MKSKGFGQIAILLLIGALITPLFPCRLYADTITGFDYTLYYQREYLQGDGTAYIDTSYSDASKNTKYTGKFEIGTTTGVIYGAGMGTNTSSYYQLLWLYSHSGDDITYRIRTSTYGSTISKSYTDGEGTQIEFDVSQSSITFKTFTGTTIYSNSSPSSGTSNITRSIYVFANHSSSGAVNIFDGKIYWLKIENTSSNTVNRYLIPAERKSDGVIGMYDVQNGVFYTNAGSGSFSAGPRLNTTYTITTSVTPAGSGTVTGGGTVNAGATVTLTATANTGYEFVRWSDNDTNNPRTFVASSDATYTAVFQQTGTPVNRYTVTTGVSPSGTGAVSGGGTYDENTVVTLTATPVNGYVFTQWSNGITTNPYSFTLTSDITITAQFSQSPTPSDTYTVTTYISPSGAGTVTGGGTYAAGSHATLRASASAGYVFRRWSDGVTVNPRDIEVNSDITVTAQFQRDYSHSTVIGINIYIIDSENYQTYMYYMDDVPTTINGVQWYRIIPYSVHAPTDSTDYISDTSIWQFDVIFNDDYMGEFRVYGDDPNGNRVFSKTVYVNGSSVSFTNIENNGYWGDSIVLSYSTAGLVKKQTIETILQDGTSESNQSVDDAQSEISDFNDASSSLIDQEDAFKDDMNDALDNIPSFDISTGFGSKFLASADWVREQYNRLTGNTPFGSVISFSLLIGLALLIVGKVYK